jgi:twinkle protein
VSSIIAYSQCPQCAEAGKDTDKNNLVTYEDDGASKCHACGLYLPPDKEHKSMELQEGTVEGKVAGIDSRNIPISVSRIYNIQQGVNKRSEPILIFTWYNTDGSVHHQKLKTRDKKITRVGKSKDGYDQFWGQHLFNPSPSVFITITEGEEDAAAVATACGTQYPAVSLPDGAQSTKSCILKNLNYLMGFKHVVLCFDEDEAGRKAVAEALAILPIDKVRIAHLPRKDASEMTKNLEFQELKQALFNAAAPAFESSLVTISDVIEEVCIQKPFGKEWPWPELTRLTYGMHVNSLYSVIAPEGSGKTEFMKDVIFHCLNRGQKVGVYSFEQQPADLIKRYISNKIGERIYLPQFDSEHWENIVQDVRREAMEYNDRLFVYDSARGTISIKQVVNEIKGLYKIHGLDVFVLDNLTAMLPAMSLDGYKNEQEYANYIVGELFHLKNQIPITVFLIGHTTRDGIQKQVYLSTSPKNAEAYDNMGVDGMNRTISKPGMDWESGRVASVGNIRCPAVSQFSDAIFVGSRNQVSEDPVEQRIFWLHVKKNRLDSRSVGKKVGLLYNETTGTLQSLDQGITQGLVCEAGEY